MRDIYEQKSKGLSNSGNFYLLENWSSMDLNLSVIFKIVHYYVPDPLLSTSFLLSQFSHLIIKTAYEIRGQSCSRIRIKTKFLDSKSLVSPHYYIHKLSRQLPV